MDEGLESIFDFLDGAVVRPEFSFEAETCLDLDLVFVVKQHHALADVTACLRKPLFRRFVDVDQNRAHLACSHRENWHSVAMDALDLDHGKGSLKVWTQEDSLVLSEDPLVHNALQYEDSGIFIVALLGVGLRIVELAAKRLLLLVGLGVLVLQRVQEALEKGDALLGNVADLKDRAHNLALHLSIYQNDVLFILDYVADFASDLPNLSSELVHNVFEYGLLLDEVCLGQHHNHRHFECKCNAEVIQHTFLKLNVVFQALVGVDYDQGVVRVVCAEASDHLFGISFMAAHVDEVNDLRAVFHDLRPAHVSKLA